MLLQRLVEYARDSEDVIPPFYARKPVRWVLELDPDGAPAGGLIDLAEPSEPGRKAGVVHVVPTITRTVAISPTIGVDTPEYVFGWVGDGGNVERVSRQHIAFRSLARDWAASEDDGGPGHTIASFYDAGHHEKIAKPSTWSRSDLVAFRIDGEFAHQHRSAARFWSDVAGGRKGLGRRGLCLVCGTVGELLRTMPQQIQQRWVPGATQSASLVSINESVHGFGLTKFLEHTPICVDCGLATMAALTALLANARHSTTYAGQDARLAWWVTGEAELDLTVLDQPEAETVQHLINSAARGRPTGEEDLSSFCALVVGGNVARVVVREWIEMPLHEVQKNLGRWFAEHRIVDIWTGQERHLGVTQLARSAGRWMHGRGAAPGSYAKLGARGEDRPHGLYRGLLGAALLKRPLPHRLLAHVVRRIRTDGRVDTPRAALLRLAMIRRAAIPNREAFMPTLNTDNQDPAYLCGRVFAELEDLQRAVTYVRGGEQLNVTFADRYFARAVTSPAVALVAGRRDARAWLKRLRRERPSWTAAYERRLDELFAEIAAAGGIPHGAVLAQQAAFILGYHQQRAALRAERAAARQGGTTDLPTIDDDLRLSEGEHE